MSARLIQRARTARMPGDAGMSLPELLVAMVLSVIIGAMTLLMVVKLTDATSRTTDHTSSAAGARNVIQAWTGYLRVADGQTAGSRTNRFEWLTANDALFYADLSNRSMSNPGVTAGATMIWLRRDTNSQLIEETFPATATATSPANRWTTCRQLVRNLNGTFSVFQGLDSSFSTLTAGTAPTVGAGCQPLPVTPSTTRTSASTTTLQNLYAVTIDFTVTDSKNQHPIEFTSQAVLPSLGVVG